MGGLSDKLTPKEKAFTDEYIANKGNGTAAALKVYDTTNENVAANLAWENIRKPKIQQELREAAEIAKNSIIGLSAGAKNENVKLNASKDILDRTGFKVEEEKQGMTVNVNFFQNPQMLLVTQEYESKLKTLLENV